jgi:sirohydrochlorin ferrochelatase
LAAVGLPLLLIGLWIAPGEAPAGDVERSGILLLAHGAHAPAPVQRIGGDTGHQHGHAISAARNVWNDNVERLARRLDEKHPTEVAFGMADPASIQAAIDRLERRGVTEIAAIPLFVSSHSPIIGNFRYILGLQEHLAKTTSLRHLDRVTSGARFVFGGGMDAHPLISEILLDRAQESSSGGEPAKASLILVAHGPNTEEENRLWLQDMEAHATYLRERGGFRSVSVLTHRNDAPPEIKAAAKAAFRRTVEEATRDGYEVVVVPLLLSSGGVEKEVEADLAGLLYRFGKPLMPHPNIERWVEARFEELLDGGTSGRTN